MLKKLRSKKFALPVAILLVVALLGGATMAWFVVTGGDNIPTTQLATLDFEVKYYTYAEDNPEFYGPGEFDPITPGGSTPIRGEITNTGDTLLIARLDYKTLVTLIRNEAGVLYSEGGTRIIENDPNITVEFDEDVLVTVFNPDASGSIWQKDEETGVYYVTLTPGFKADFEFEIICDGPGMGNEYMGGVISFDGAWTATVPDYDSVEYAFGLTIEEWAGLSYINMPDYSGLG